MWLLMLRVIRVGVILMVWVRLILRGQGRARVGGLDHGGIYHRCFVSTRTLLSMLKEVGDATDMRRQACGSGTQMS